MISTSSTPYIVEKNMHLCTEPRVEGHLPYNFTNGSLIRRKGEANICN